MDFSLEIMKTTKIYLFVKIDSVESVNPVSTLENKGSYWSLFGNKEKLGGKIRIAQKTFVV